MSASATKCRPPPAHTPLTAAITGFQTSLCHAVRRSCEVLACVGDCSRSASGSLLSCTTSRPVWNARPSPVLTITRTVGVGVELAPRGLQLGHHARVHRVARVGPVEHQPADRTAVVRRAVSRTPSAVSCAGSRATAARWYGSGSRGQPEHALAEDVLVDLGGAALDRVGPAPQHPAHLGRQATRPSSSASHASASAPRRSTARSWTRWLRPPWCTLPTELSGPGERPAFTSARTRWFVQSRMRSSE